MQGQAGEMGDQGVQLVLAGRVRAYVITAQQPTGGGVTGQRTLMEFPEPTQQWETQGLSGAPLPNGSRASRRNGGHHMQSPEPALHPVTSATVLPGFTDEETGFQRDQAVLGEAVVLGLGYIGSISSAGQNKK